MLPLPASSFVFLAVLALSVASADSAAAAAAGGGDNLRIIGGSVATPHEFPFIVWIRSGGTGSSSSSFLNMIRLILGTAYTTNCAGVILTEDWVVTAAHCVAGQDPSSIRVYAGVQDRRQLYVEHQQLAVRRIVVHHNYELSSFRASSDIALLQLTSRFQFNEHVKAIDIESSSSSAPPQARAPVTIAGWGLTSTKATQGSVKLMKLTTTVVSLPACRTAYRAVIPIDDSHLCTDTSKETGSCFGDSGSPVLCRRQAASANGTDTDTDFVLCGIVSGGKGCADPKYFQVNTDVASFVNWIKKIVYNRNNFVFSV